MTINDTIVLRMYEGDGAWRESVAAGDVTATEIMNDQALLLAGYVFGHRDPLWWQKNLAMFRVLKTEPPTFAVSVGTQAEMERVAEAATRVFHHEVIRLCSHRQLNGPAPRFHATLYLNGHGRPESDHSGSVREICDWLTGLEADGTNIGSVSIGRIIMEG